MRRIRSVRLMIPVLLAIQPVLSNAQAYKAERQSDHGIKVIHLVDTRAGVEVLLVPSIGNRGIELKVHGKNILYFPQGDAAGLQKQPALSGIPFLAPWANRLDEQGFWANGKHYLLNPSLGNTRIGNNGLPIHGVLPASPLWQVKAMGADADSAYVTSRLEFWKHPELMAQWPFAHEYEMTYRLAQGTLQVETTINNLGDEPMPISIGFHPYFQIPDKPRDEWTVHLPVQKMIVADDRLIPTGELRPADLPDPVPLKGRLFDTGFTDLSRDANGLAHFVVESGGEEIEILFGPKYPVTVVYEPPSAPDRPNPFICIEPMAAITNALNLNHKGKYPDLPMLAPGAKWTESFWISAKGL